MSPFPAHPICPWRQLTVLANCSLWLVIASLAALLHGCSDTGELAQSPDPDVHTYIVHGILRQLPDPEDPSKQLLILHQAIPNWINEEGYETGMPGMTMPFPPAPDIDLSPFSPGDRVRFTLRVNWEKAPRLQLTRIEPWLE